MNSGEGNEKEINMLKALVKEFFAWHTEGLEEAVNVFLSNWSREHGSKKQIISVTAHTVDERNTVYTFFYSEKPE